MTSFLGTVRNENQGRRVERLEYEAYEPLAVKSFERIAAEASERWPDTHVAVHHRIGALAIGEASVAIAAASPHRARRLRGVPLRDRAHQADCAHLEARVLRGRGEVWIEGRDSRPPMTRRPAAGAFGVAWRVTVRLFARLRDITGASELARELPGGSTANTLWNLLADEHPELAGYRGAVSVAVNAEYARMDARIADGDEIAFLPPVSGG